MKKLLFILSLGLSLNTYSQTIDLENELIEYNLNPGLYIYQDINNKTKETCVTDFDILSSKRTIYKFVIQNNNLNPKFCKITTFEATPQSSNVVLECYQEPYDILVQTQWLYNLNDFFIMNTKKVFNNDKKVKEYKYVRKFSRVGECNHE